MKTLHHIGLALAVGLCLPLGGCNDIVQVDSPDVIDPGKLQDANGAAALRAGAIGDFAFAVDGDGGATEGQTLVSGLLSDEYRNSDTFGTRQEVDQRAIQPANTTLTTVFRLIHRARLGAERAALALTATASDPTTDPRIAEMWDLAGFSYVIIGENYCSGVPFPAEGQTNAPPIATNEIFSEAIARFDKAIANFGGDNTRLWTALVGKARALLDQNQPAAAAALLNAVPDGFKYVIQHSVATAREQNGVYVFNALSKRWSMSDREGGTGLPYLTANDPRVPYVAKGAGFDAVTPLFVLLKYKDYADPTILASGVEARLIEAEAALSGGDNAGWLAKLNALRATVTGLAPLADPGTAAARVDMMFSERAFWLYATGHRLGDLRRLVRHYGRGAETVYPTGAFSKGGVYGTDVNLPVPTDEQNNPSYPAGSCQQDAV
jgi:starch-binding outer membrane protein, SusD/RagB family